MSVCCHTFTGLLYETSGVGWESETPRRMWTQEADRVTHEDPGPVWRGDGGVCAELATADSGGQMEKVT